MTMYLRLLCTAIFLGVLGFCSAQKEDNDCIKANAKSCGECIQVSEKCGWCRDVTFLKHGVSNSVRCDELESLVKRGCKASMIENPRGEYSILRNKPVTTTRLDGAETLPPEQITQIQPQKLTLKLRSGEPQTFSLKFKLANSLSSEVILENSKLPRGVSITYKSICKNGVVRTGQNGRKCSKISIGDEVVFEISIESRKCPNKGMPKTIKIKPMGSTEEVEIVLNFICECDCHNDRQPNSELCSSDGFFECGTCRCNEGRVGRQCECSTEEVRTDDMDASCRGDYGTDICSNNGDCVCGTCECKRRENPEELYSGRYCECDNFNCDRSNNKLCGGHGRCECRVCICDSNYTGSACDCSLDTTTCLAANQQICNGRGTCDCGVCKCTDPKFQGPTCEICPTCPGVCTEHKECVQCLAFGTGEKRDTCERDCGYMNLIRVQDRDKMPQPDDQDYPLTHCKERDSNDCWFYYTYAVRELVKEVHVVETLECPESAEWSIMEAIQALFRGLCYRSSQ